MGEADEKGTGEYLVDLDDCFSIYVFVFDVP